MIRRDIGLEQFFTPHRTAEWVVDVCRDQPWWGDIVEAIEPTAGAGSFVRALKRHSHYMTVHAIDLEPRHADVTQGDTLEVTVADLLLHRAQNVPTPRGHVLLIGNPPFGRQSRLAGQIWDHYAPWVGYTAFIAPRSMAYPKYLTKSRGIPRCHDLLFTLALPSNMFELPDGTTKEINGVALLVTQHVELRDRRANPVAIRGNEWRAYA